MPTVVTHSIGATGRDYSTLNAWEAATDNDHVTADEQIDGEMYDDADFTSVSEQFNGSTTDATRFRRLTVATGEEYDVVADTGVWLDSATGNTLWLDEDYFELIGPMGITNSGGRCILGGGGYTQLTVGRVYAEVTGSGTHTVFWPIGAVDTYSSIFSYAGTGSPSYVVRLWATGQEMWNCIVDGGDQSSAGFFRGSGDTTLSNCYAFASTTDYDANSGTLTSTDNCASEDATAGDTALRNLDPATELEGHTSGDFRLASGSTLEDAGTDNSGTFTASIEAGVDHGDASGSWNVGPYDGVVGAPPSAPGWLEAISNRRTKELQRREAILPVRPRFDRPQIITAPTIPDEPGFLELIIQRRSRERALRHREPWIRPFKRPALPPTIPTVSIPVPGFLAAFVERRAKQMALRAPVEPRRAFQRPVPPQGVAVPEVPAAGFVEALIKRRVHERSLRTRDLYRTRRHQVRPKPPVLPTAPTVPDEPGFLEHIARRRASERLHRVPIPRHRHFRRPILPSVPPTAANVDHSYLAHAIRRTRSQRIRM